VNDNLAKILQNPVLSARGESRTYSDENLQAISFPVGGIGSGLIQINGKAERHIWQISNSFCQAYVPNSFFAVRTQINNNPPVIKALQTSNFGPFEKMEQLTFRGEYPFGWFDFRDKKLPLEITLETFNPLIPLNEKDSATPCAIYNITAENTSSEPVEVSFLATQQNTIGFEEVVRPGSPPTGAIFADLEKINADWKSEEDEFEEEGKTKITQKQVSPQFEIKQINLFANGMFGM
jgi:uncharacterized protein (DUF608 family)